MSSPSPSSSSSPSNNLQAYLSRILTKLQEATSKKDKHKPLRDSLRVALDIVQDSGSFLSLSDPNQVTDYPEWDSLLNRLVTPFQLITEKKSNASKLFVYATDCLFRLVSHGYLRGSVVDETEPDSRLVNRVINILIKYADVNDDAVQSQVVKTLVAAVESPLCDIHRASLLNVVKCCYQLHVTAKTQSKTHQEAKAGLQKILSLVFERLRTYVSSSTSKTNININNNNNNNNNNNSIAAIKEVVSTPTPQRMVQSVPSTNSILEDLTPNIQQIPPSPHQTSLSTNNNNNNNNNTNNVELDSIDIDNYKEEESDGEPSDSESSMASHNPSALVIAPSTSTPHTTPDNASEVEPESNDLDSSVIFDDALNIFVHLCKLASLSIGEKEATNVESVEMKSKILALENLLSVLETTGPAFRGMEKFVAVGMRQNLTPIFLVNGVSPVPRVLKIALSIFLHVISYFRDLMKDCIGIVFQRVLLKALDSPATSTLQQRWMVLQVLHQLCRNPQALVEIFVNFDCDVNAKDVFEKMVHSLAKVAQGTAMPDHKAAANPQDLQVKTFSLECVVTLLRSLSDWSKDLYDSQEEIKFPISPNLTSTRLPIDTTASPLNLSPVDQVNYFQQQKQRKQLVEQGKQKFHLSFKKGMQFFFENDILKKEPKDVAKFFRYTDGLNKTKIGEYLGEKEDFNIDVLNEFSKCFTFKDCSLYHVRPMFALVWYPVLAAFSVPMENTEDQKVVLHCLEGFQHAVRISGLFGMDLERSAFITSLLKFTTLDSTIQRSSGVNITNVNNLGMEIMSRHKCSESIRTLLMVAFSDGNYLKESWVQVLRCVSLMERLKIVPNPDLDKIDAVPKFPRSQSKADFFKGAPPVAQRDNRDPTNPEKVHAQATKENETNVDPTTNNNNNNNNANNVPNLTTQSSSTNLNANVNNAGEKESSQLDLTLVEKLYLHSARLKSGAIDHFVKALCDVSQEEIALPLSSTFSLEKIIEIAFINCTRQWDVWERIWLIMADFFIKIGSIQTPDKQEIALFSIDVLRRLAMKFLEKDDLMNQGFQKDIIRPFELIFAGNPNVPIRDRVIRCFSQMIMTKANVIKSGWKGIFTVFTSTAQIPVHTQPSAQVQDENLVSLAFEMVEEIVREYFHHIAADYFINCVNCLSSFANRLSRNVLVSASPNDSREICIRAIDALSFCSVQLANGRVTPLMRTEQNTQNTPNTPTEETPNTDNVVKPPIIYPIFTDNEKHISLWFPLLTGLSRVASHRDVELRKSALDTLFRTLALFGTLFSPKLWELIFRGVVLPVFDNVGYGRNRNRPELKNSSEPPLAEEVLSEDNDWLVSTCPMAFNHLVEMYTTFVDTIPFLLDDILDLFVCCIIQGNEVLARTAAHHVQQLILSNGLKLSPSMWSIVCSHIGKCVRSLVPYELVDALQNAMGSLLPVPTTTPLPIDNNNNITPVVNGEKEKTASTPNSKKQGTPAKSPSVLNLLSSSLSSVTSNPPTSQNNTNINTNTNTNNSSNNSVNNNTNAQSVVSSAPFKKIRTKCIVQLLMIQTTTDIALSQYQYLQTSHLISLSSTLEGVYHWAHAMGIRLYLQDMLAQIGLGENIKKMEISSIGCYIKLMLKMYSEKSVDSENRRVEAEVRLIKRCYEIIQEYVGAKEGPAKDSGRQTIVVQILKGYFALDNDQFLKHLGIFYPLFTQLLLNDNKDIRAVLRDLIIRVGSIRTTTPTTQNGLATSPYKLKTSLSNTDGLDNHSNNNNNNNNNNNTNGKIHVQVGLV